MALNDTKGITFRHFEQWEIGNWGINMLKSKLSGPIAPSIATRTKHGTPLRFLDFG